MKHPLDQTWELDSLFPGGSSSQAFASFLEETGSLIGRLQRTLEGMAAPQTVAEAGTLDELVSLIQQIMHHMGEADSFTACLMAADMNDKQALRLSGIVRQLSAEYQSALTKFDQLLSEIPDETWQQLVKRDKWDRIGFNLSERRTLAKEKLPPELEALAGDLAVDGYHGWSSLYDTTVSTIRIPFVEDGKTVTLSAGQAANKLLSGDREVRSALFRKWEQAWADKADFCAEALNHLGGFRLQLYKHRGWDSVHKEPLQINRMQQETLDVMWETIERNKEPLVRYLERKAKLFGVERLSWHDVDAPIGKQTVTVSYDDAADMIIEQFGRFSPKMAAFAREAFEKRWIEAEDRPGKRPGGFCTSFPLHKQTRIFMTYAGMASNVSTLAHELGHAYHQHVMNDLPALAQDYAMNVAETASTFAEMVVSDAAVRLARDEQEKLALIEDKIQRAVAFFMNIHARFLFETRFYEERKRGLVSVERLNELMVEAQREAYRDALGEYHPHFWASKLHFYITEVPFYNFPYTFGYLFSAGIYQRVRREGTAFEDKYADLLRDTASMPVEELAMKHLGADLTKPDFWQSAIDLCLEDVDTFLAMTE